MKKQSKFVDKFYRLTRESAPLSFMLASRNSNRFPLLHFDEEQGTNRALRYARNQKSPFEDEQDGNAILEPIVFEDGILFVPKQNQVLQKFLNIHPQNGNLYEEINQERDAAEELSIVEMELEAQIIAKGLKTEKLITIARVLLGGDVDKMSTTEIKRDILLYAKQEPIDFMDSLNDPMLDLQDKVFKFFNAGYLSYRNNNKDVYFSLPKNKKKMLTIPFGEEPIFIISSYFQSDDGIETFKALEKRLKTEDQ
tara:strand:- start:31513 stop:32271 length:759 start_codon:yes stop_codon:yes gene_type:complete